MASAREFSIRLPRAAGSRGKAMLAATAPAAATEGAGSAQQQQQHLKTRQRRRRRRRRHSGPPPTARARETMPFGREIGPNTPDGPGPGSYTIKSLDRRRAASISQPPAPPKADPVSPGEFYYLPSDFEPLQNRGPSFGRAQRRMAKRRMAEEQEQESTPGPGSYNLPPATERPGTRMAWRRFERAETDGPGPAAYRLEVTGQAPSGATLTGRHTVKEGASLPGLANYMPSDSLSLRDSNRGATLTGRPRETPPPATPGPQDYRPADPSPVSAGVSISGRSVTRDTPDDTPLGYYLPSSVQEASGAPFAGRHYRGSMFEGDLSLPGPGWYDEPTSKTSGLSTSLGPRLSSPRPVHTPGPGAYDLPSPDVIHGAMPFGDAERPSPATQGSFFLRVHLFDFSFPLTPRRVSKRKFQLLARTPFRPPEAESNSPLVRDGLMIECVTNSIFEHWPQHTRQPA
jgi:Sperm-tail PG-rich repeat